MQQKTNYYLLCRFNLEFYIFIDFLPLFTILNSIYFLYFISFYWTLLYGEFARTRAQRRSCPNIYIFFVITIFSTMYYYNYLEQQEKTTTIEAANARNFKFNSIENN